MRALHNPHNDPDEIFVDRNYTIGGVQMERDDFNLKFKGKKHYGKGPKGWKYSDEKIKEMVNEALYRDYFVDATDIEVEVKDGCVQLKGSIVSREAKKEAERCVESVDGVMDVLNQLTIKSE